MKMLRGKVQHWNSPARVADLFEDTASKNSSQTAAIYNGRIISYEDLDAVSNRFARRLSGQLTREELFISDEHRKLKCVGVFMESGINRLTVMLALMKLDVAFLPLDEVIPINRIKMILRDTKPMCVISSTLLYDNMMSRDVLAEGCAVYLYEHLSETQDSYLSAKLDAGEKVKNSPKDSCFCILYTSGSTGQPKGIRQLNSNWVNRFNWQFDEVPFKSGDFGLSKKSMIFADSISELLGPLLSGIPVVIIDKKTAQNPNDILMVIQERCISHLILVPSLLRNILRSMVDMSIDHGLLKLRYVVCSGEALTVDLALLFFEMFPDGTTLANYYGTTELTSDVTILIMHNRADVEKYTYGGILSIGKPLANTNVYVVDKELNPTSGSGEILISGANVTGGYMKPKILDVFVKNHIVDELNHGTLFRTGDFGFIVDGIVIYEGREDATVEICGERVNMGEIERVVQSYDTVDKAVVLYCDDAIVVFCRLIDGLKKNGIEDFCKKSLPSHKLPAILILEQFPLQPATGKIDRFALKNMFRDYRNLQLGKTTDIDTVATDVMATISQVLGAPLAYLKLKDNFFEIGGNSVSFVKVWSRLRMMGYRSHLDSLIYEESIGNVIKHLKSENNASKSRPIPYDNSNYRVNPVTDDIMKQKIITGFSEMVSRKDALHMSLGISKQESREYIECHWPWIVKSGGSCACVDESGSRVLGASLVVPQNIPQEQIKTIKTKGYAYIQEFRNFVGGSLEVTGATKNIAVSFNVGVYNGLSPQEDVLITKLLLHETVRLAKENGFAGIVACDLNETTSVLSTIDLGFETRVKVSLREYVASDGTMPFATAPKDSKARFQVKYFNNRFIT